MADKYFRPCQMNQKLPPALRLNVQLIVTKSVDHAPRPSYFIFPKELAVSLVPANIAKKSGAMKRVVSVEAKQTEASMIRLVDGTKMILAGNKIVRSRLQPKQEEKLESQASIRKCRTQERIFSELLRIFSTGQIHDHILKRSVWRISRVVPSEDLRSYTVYWVIDDETDVVNWKVPTMNDLIMKIYT